MFTEQRGQNAFQRLLEHPCPKWVFALHSQQPSSTNSGCVCSFRCPGLPPFTNHHALKDHLRRTHELFFCDICVEHLKVCCCLNSYCISNCKYNDCLVDFLTRTATLQPWRIGHASSEGWCGQQIPSWASIVRVLWRTVFGSRRVVSSFAQGSLFLSFLWCRRIESFLCVSTPTQMHWGGPVRWHYTHRFQRSHLIARAFPGTALLMWRWWLHREYLLCSFPHRHRFDR